MFAISKPFSSSIPPKNTKVVISGENGQFDGEDLR